MMKYKMICDGRIIEVPKEFEDRFHFGIYSDEFEGRDDDFDSKFYEFYNSIYGYITLKEHEKGKRRWDKNDTDDLFKSFGIAGKAIYNHLGLQTDPRKPNELIHKRFNFEKARLCLRETYAQYFIDIEFIGTFINMMVERMAQYMIDPDNPMSNNIDFILYIMRRMTENLKLYPDCIFAENIDEVYSGVNSLLYAISACSPDPDRCYDQVRLLNEFFKKNSKKLPSYFGYVGVKRRKEWG